MHNAQKDAQFKSKSATLSFAVIISIILEWLIAACNDVNQHRH